MVEPRGIETLVALAAVDEALARLLLEDRDAAVAQSGVALTETERRVLTAIDDAALQAMIGRFAGGIADEDRRSFLGRSATAILTLVAGGSLLGAGGGGGGGGGIPGGIGGITPGRGHSSLRPPSRTRVVMGKLTVTGGLSKEIVRRIIRRHINEVKYCYEKEQLRQPKLEGTLVLAYLVSSTGQVVRSKVSAGTLKNRKVELCVQRAARRWLHPKPTDGKPLEVSCELGLYPFEQDRARKKPPVKKPPAKKPPAKKQPPNKRPSNKKKAPANKKTPEKGDAAKKTTDRPG